MQTDSNLQLEKLLVDGGMTKNDLLMQIQADFLGQYKFYLLEFNGSGLFLSGSNLAPFDVNTTLDSSIRWVVFATFNSLQSCHLLADRALEKSSPTDI